MDQAAAQPARANSAAPAHPIATAPAHASTVAPAHAGTVAHTAQPVGFWTETFKPAVVWNAASATATALAVIAAFLVPKLAEIRQRKARRRYAQEMLRPVYYEAAGAVRLAKHCMKLMREIVPLMESDADQARAAACGGLAFDPIAGAFFPSEMALKTVHKLASTTFPAYAANRSWLIDLEPREAGLVHNAFTEAERVLARLVGIIDKWVLARDVGRFQVAILANYAEAIHTSMFVASQVLQGATGAAPDIQEDQE